jgi:hypothetical protein
MAWGQFSAMLKFELANVIPAPGNPFAPVFTTDTRSSVETGLDLPIAQKSRPSQAPTEPADEPAPLATTMAQLLEALQGADSLFQQALGLARRLGVEEVDLLGFTGRRVDHTLWNLSLLKVWGAELRLRFLDDYCETRLIRSRVRFQAPLGQRLSLCPLAGPVAGVRTQGLRFPLHGEELIPGLRDGISNEVTTNPVEISVASGDLLLVIQREGAVGPIVWEEG